METWTKKLLWNGNDIETVDRFSYLGDVFSAEGEVQEAVISRMRSAWKKFKGVSSILC